jgi:heat shock protein HslJ
MQKNIFIVLFLMTVTLSGYTGWSAFAIHEDMVKQELEAAANKQKATAAKIFTTKQGKKINLEETHPQGESMSTITLNLTGFEKNDSIVLEKNKLMSATLLDINKDEGEEFVLITQAVGSGSYGEATIFTTIGETLTSVKIQNIEEKDLAKGGLFEGYMGHDTFSVENGTLIRSFPTYISTDTNDNPTGPVKKVSYVLDGSTTTPAITFSLLTAGPKTSSSTQVTETEKTLKAELPGTSWVWTSTTGDGATSPAPAGGKFVISFGKDNKVTSLTDCNALQGTYTSQAKTLSLKVTQEGTQVCSGSKELSYKTLLAFVTSYNIKGDELTLVIGSRGVMTFKNK